VSCGSERYIFGEKTIPFRIKAHDPRLFKEYKKNWEAADTNSPEWTYDEADREEEVFLHRIGKSPKLRNFLKIISNVSEDKIPESGSTIYEKDKTDAILIDEPQHIELIRLLSEDSIQGSHCLVTSEWNKTFRCGVSNVNDCNLS
jgi:hypothetical protein